MITRELYKKLLSVDGQTPTLAEIRRHQSQDIINETFTDDFSYKIVRILTYDGWKEVECKYQYHQGQSIDKDTVDWYLQFRPGVHFPIGSYVIIPDDNDSLNTYEDEVEWFSIDNFGKRLMSSERSQLWMIVNRDDANDFVRYNVLQCDWDLRWINNGKIEHVIGCSKNASSYTSGIWTADYSVGLDNLTSMWIPNLYSLYNDHLEKLGLSDNRQINHGDRFFLTANNIHPNIYKISKIVDSTPFGVVKLSMKQDMFNGKQDNVDLMICNYYTDTGHVEVTEPIHISEDIRNIIKLVLNDDNELIDGGLTQGIIGMSIGETGYFGLNDDSEMNNLDWRITINSDYSDSKHADSYYEKLIKLQKIDDSSVCVKVGKAKSIVGKRFTLCVYDDKQNPHSQIELEITDAT